MIDAIKELDKTERERKEDENALLEILIEMNLRGVHVKPIDIYASDATEYQLSLIHI